MHLLAEQIAALMRAAPRCAHVGETRQMWYQASRQKGALLLEMTCSEYPTLRAYEASVRSVLLSPWPRCRILWRWTLVCQFRLQSARLVVMQ